MIGGHIIAPYYSVIVFLQSINLKTTQAHTGCWFLGYETKMSMGICQNTTFGHPPYRFWSNRILCIYCSTVKDLDTLVFGSVWSDQGDPF